MIRTTTLLLLLNILVEKVLKDVGRESELDKDDAADVGVFGH